jgi:hypothetical protein
MMATVAVSDIQTKDKVKAATANATAMLNLTYQ